MKSGFSAQVLPDSSPGKPAEFLGELLQNAQRSSASRVWVTFPDAVTCVIQDNGHGLIQGVESLRALLVFSDSSFANPVVEAHERPLGMGFYALIANERITHLRLESCTATDEQMLVFEMDTQRWLDDKAYRENWQSRVLRRDRQGEDNGFRVTLTG